LGKLWRAFERKTRFFLLLAIHYGHLVHFMAVCYLSCNLAYFSQFWYIVARKIWQPCLGSHLLHYAELGFRFQWHVHWIVQFESWDRCYEHNFRRFLTIFGKKCRFFSKTNVMVNFLQKLAVVWSKNAKFFSSFLAKIFLKS
jgi:hypothetical protein